MQNENQIDLDTSFAMKFQGR